MGLKFNPITGTLDLVGSGTTYTLPTASASVLGGVKVGARLSIDGSGVLSADVQSGGGDVLGPATNTADYIPQWNGANSKTLKDGLAVPAGGLAGLTALGTKQDTLVSGTNIKTINSTSLLGSGDIAISASPGGSDTQVQFNDGGSLNGDSGLTYDKSGTGKLVVGGSNGILGNIGLELATNNSILFKENSSYYKTSIKVEDATIIDDNGTSLNIFSGGSNGTGNGGNIRLVCGKGGNSGKGGSISVIGGAGGSTSGDGGDVYLQGGSNTSGINGHVLIGDPDNYAAIFDPSLILTTNKTFTFPNRSITFDNITTSTTTNGTGFLKGNGSVISFDNSTYLTSVGTGVANEITYWSGTNTLGSLATATYPSLIELSYVKGVTSSIQTQLNAKGVGDMLLGTAQSVTAEKKFTKDKLTMLGTSTGKLIISNALTNGTDYTATFPAKTGTVAMTSDIVSQVEDSIVDGHTTIAPSGNAVFDALALKAPLTSPTFATSINGSYLTASQILGTDASKNIVSLPVATYPSLTELSYVKGVTSAIQTQIGNLVPKSLYDANTILYATTDNTPVALTIAEQKVVGRITGGAISALSIDSDLTPGFTGDTSVPSSKAAKTYSDTKIANSLVDAKGDLITASADNTPARLAVGTDGQSPIADSSKANGLSYFDNNSSMFRQAIINGNFDVWQRGTTFTTPNDDTYIADRWNILVDGNGAWTFSQSAVVSAKAPYSLKCVNVTQNKQCGIVQILEAKDSQKFYNQTVNLSFQARTTTGKEISNLRCALLKWGGTADSVTSDVVGTWAGAGTNPTWAANWTVIGTPTNLALTTSFTKYSQNHAVGENTNNIAVVIWTDDTTITAGDEFYIDEIQLCAGDVALPFMPKSYEEELRACQRYCYVPILGAYASVLPMTAQSTTLARGALFLPVNMRTTGTLTATGTDYLLANIVETIDCTAIAKDDAIASTPSLLMIKATTAGSLTAHRPYYLAADETAGRLFVVSAEL